MRLVEGLRTRPVAYYANTTGVRIILLLARDIQVNPGLGRSGRRNKADETCEDQKDDYLRDFVKAMSLVSNNLNSAHINIRSLSNKVEEMRIILSLCRFNSLSIMATHLDKTIVTANLRWRTHIQDREQSENVGLRHLEKDVSYM